MALKYIKGSDILPLPSRAEGMPIVVLKAVALKVPVVATSLVSIRELLESEVGVLVVLNNSTTIVRAVGTLIEDSRMRKHIVESLQTYPREFTWEIIMEKYIDLYERILSL